jgi:hypothetical protein
MSDSRNFRDLRFSYERELTNMHTLNIKDHNEYRNFLQKNASIIMTTEYSNYHKKDCNNYGCFHELPLVTTNKDLYDEMKVYNALKKSNLRPVCKPQEDYLLFNNNEPNELNLYYK